MTYLNDDEILITDTSNGRIKQINIQTGTVVNTLGRAVGKGEFHFPSDVCLDEERRIVVTEFWKSRIQVMSPEGETISIFGNIDPEKLNNSKSCFPYKDKFSYPIAEIIALRLSTSREHSYTDLANGAIKMDNLTARMVCL